MWGAQHGTQAELSLGGLRPGLRSSGVRTSLQDSRLRSLSAGSDR
jgi:hypothetical protein